VAAHDGFTLADVLRYAHRHNLANGENNRDGHGHNLSNNCGVEGATDRPDVLARRQQWQRVLLAVTLLSLGTPMVQAGDSIGHSQGGNNNAYCQDNATSWLDWGRADTRYAHFIGALQALRRARAVLRSAQWWQAPDAASGVVARWFLPEGSSPRPEDWNDPARLALALVLESADDHGSDATNPQHAPCLLMFNSAAHAVRFVLPPGAWVLHIDTGGGDCLNQSLSDAETLQPRTLWLASAVPQ
jgi:glycogen operon protein